MGHQELDTRAFIASTLMWTNKGYGVALNCSRARAFYSFAYMYAYSCAWHPGFAAGA